MNIERIQHAIYLTAKEVKKRKIAIVIRWGKQIMQDIIEEFSNIWEMISKKCQKQYGINVGNNARFVGEIIFKSVLSKNYFSYVECGVYKGTTFFPIYHLCEMLFKKFALFALDSFSGFPYYSISENDSFRKFEMLFREGRISKDHFEAARERCSKLPKREHLQPVYFTNYAEEFFEKCKGQKNINIIKCSFDKLEHTFKNAKEKYDLVFLDCDLYLSYRNCLEFFGSRTDIFIFDEYYSLKYPGARIACDEFVSENSGWKFFKKIERNPYFERWGIKKDR